jgi:hypothetical protein
MLEEIKNTITENIWKTKIPNPIYEEGHSIHLPEETSSKYFPKEIKDYIKTHPSEKLSYKGTNPISYDVEFYCYDRTIPLTSLNRQMKLVIWWLYTIQKYTTIKCNDMKLIVYLTPFKKALPKKSKESSSGKGGSTHKVLSPINCNTGFSTRCDMASNIVIYRQEEWFKVFIHESFHYFGLDFAYDQQPFVNRNLKELFCVSPTILLFESYTEFWAEMIVMFLYAKLHKKDLSIIIQNEIDHSLSQAKKVLGCQGFTYTNVITPCKNKYEEETNVFAYYVIKTIFLYYHEEFVRWCVDNNPNILKINQSELPSLLDWIRDHYSRTEFVDAVDGANVDGDGLKMTNINI